MLKLKKVFFLMKLKQVFFLVKLKQFNDWSMNDVLCFVWRMAPYLS